MDALFAPNDMEEFEVGFLNNLFGFKGITELNILRQQSIFPNVSEIDAPFIPIFLLIVFITELFRLSVHSTILVNPLLHVLNFL
jgi:hypothetical protein